MGANRSSGDKAGARRRSGGLALIPMAVGVSFDVHRFAIQVGSESAKHWKAFALTMLFGLSFATVMTLVVEPSLLTLKYRFLDRRRDRLTVQ
ncbi:MAG: hypothetical protein ACLFRR_07675 [Spirochaetaceae bacterium]